MAKQKSAVELAKKISDDKRATELAKKKKEQEMASIRDSNRQHFIDVIKNVIEQFDRIKGINVIKQQNESEWILTQKKKNIVKVKFGWGQWED